AGRAGDNTVRLWDFTSGERLGDTGMPTASVDSVAYSPDGRQVATGSADGSVRLWDPGTGKELRRLPFGTRELGGASVVAFCPDGRTLAAGGHDYLRDKFVGLVKVWDMAKRRELWARRSDEGRV